MPFLGDFSKPCTGELWKRPVDLFFRGSFLSFSLVPDKVAAICLFAWAKKFLTSGLARATFLEWSFKMYIPRETRASFTMFSFPRKSYFQPPVLGTTIPRETASPPGAQQDIFFPYFSPGNPMGRKELCSSMKVHGRTGHYLRNRRARLRRRRQKSAGKENERDFFDLVKRTAPKR